MAMSPGLPAPGLALLHAIQAHQRLLALTAGRMATGLRIRSGSDDPGGLVRADRLTSQRLGLQAALTRMARADELLGTAAAGVDEGLAALDALDAILRDPGPQGVNVPARIDEALDAYEAAIRAVESGPGERMLTGARMIRVSGGAGSIASFVRVLRAPLRSVDLTVAVVAKGTVATLQVGVPPSATGQPASIEITGPLGSAVVTVPSVDAASLAGAVAAVTGETGVTAVAAGGSVQLTSLSAGSDQVIRLMPVSGAAPALLGAGGVEAAGTDAQVSCNGGSAVASGNSASVRYAGVRLEFEVTGTGLLRVTAAGGGLTINPSPDPDAPQITRVGLPGLMPSELGLSTLGRLSDLRTGGSLAYGAVPVVTQRLVVAEARRVLESVRGNVAAVQTSVVESAQSQLSSLLEAVQSAEVRLRTMDPVQAAIDEARADALSQAAAGALAAMMAQWQRMLLPLTGAIGL